MNPLIEVTDIYPIPLTEESKIIFNYTGQEDRREKLVEITNGFKAIIEQKREELSLSEIRPIDLKPEQAESLRNSIKSDKIWTERFNAVLSYLTPEYKNVDLTALLKAVPLPWWNSPLLFCKGDRYDASPASLVLDAELSHSYITQLRRYLMNYCSVQLEEACSKPISIINLLITNDNSIVLGLRDGHNLADTIMTVPAGSVLYHTGKNPFFETLYAEHFEETGLTKEHIHSVELIGRLDGHAIKDNPHYVSRSKINLSYDDLSKLWRSMDQKEHKELLRYEDNPEFILNELIQNTHDSSGIHDGNPVIAKDKRAILPQCGASLLAHYILQKGEEWGRKAEKALEGRYKLNFCHV